MIRDNFQIFALDMTQTYCKMTWYDFRNFLFPGIAAAGRILLVLSVASAAAVSCVKDRLEDPKFPDHIDNVLLMYAAGQNNLARDIGSNINDFCAGGIPRGNDPSIFLCYQKLAPSKTPAESYLIRYYSHNGKTAADTVAEYPPEMPAAHAGTLRRVLEDAEELFPSPSYALLFSSHATGWLPKGYYSNPGQYDSQGTAVTGTAESDDEAGSYDAAGPLQPAGWPGGWTPYFELQRDPALPPVKSIGQDYVTVNGADLSYEMDLKEFSDAIPMYLDYIFFDCCLMGGIEVAYELRDKCGKIIFSPAEVISTGFDYRTMAAKLLGGATPDLAGVCRDYYQFYANHAGGQAWRSATVTLVDCSRLGPVADICRRIFSRNEEGLSAIDPDSVQRYYTGNCHWFYDLYDMSAKAGASDAELRELGTALDGCILYKAATDTFLTGPGSSPGYGFEISTYSGFSTYLPCNGSDYLDAAYRDLDWNDATGLVM